MLVAGVLSGTSVDAIDVALVDINGAGLDLTVENAEYHAIAFPDELREAVLAASSAPVGADRISQLNFLLGRLFGEAVQEGCRCSSRTRLKLELVGSHGQTIYHQPLPSSLCDRQVASTLQIGEAACIAEAVGAPVVADFRAADIAAGGQGAPLVPYVDYLLFRHAERNRVALNIGGIANVTALPAAREAESVIAFDTGPGNMVIDELVAWISGGAQRFDRDGAIAATGLPHEDLLSDLLQDPYFSQPAPKSTGRERYGADFVSRLLERGLRSEVLVATATRLTVDSILLGLERFVRPVMEIDDLIVSGGGWHNPSIIEPLRQALPQTRVASSAEFGVDGDAKEAVAFAVLAYETYHGRPSNLPSSTGARRPVILGKIVPRPA